MSLQIRAEAELELRRRRANMTLSDSPYAVFKRTYRDDPVAFIHDCIKWPEGKGPVFFQDEIMADLQKQPRVSARAPHGVGKAQPNSLIIDTPAGKRRFGDLSVGDYVFGANGLPVRVFGVFERGEMDVYKVIFNDGSETLCSLDHLWTVRKFDWNTKENTTWITLSLKELLEKKLTRSNGSNNRARKWAIPTIAPLEYPYRWVPVDPYTLGIWLGDGSRGTSHISGIDQEIPNHIRDAGYVVNEKQDRTCLTWTVLGLSKQLMFLNILDCGSHTKYIPTCYLENVSSVRRELLRGLLDTDGTVSTWGLISYASVSKALADGVAQLARSLGGMARVHERHNKYGAFWNVSLTLPKDTWFYIKRKQDRVRPVSQKRYLWRWIDKVEFVGKEPVRCISIENEDGLYVANDAIVTHNTALMSWAILWFSLTNDGDADWKVPVTASAWRQLTKFAFPELHKWAHMLDWKKIGRSPFDERLELKDLSLRLSTGEAFALASDNPALIEGAHADRLLYIFDESKEIPVPTWDSAEGAFSTGDTRWLAVSTPGEPSGRFYDIQSRQAGFEHWTVRHVTLAEAIQAGRIKPEWAENCRKQWGEGSAVYQNRVLGEFASSEADGIIPLTWVEKANQRWSEWKDAGAVLPDFVCVGVDVARSGDDKTVLALRFGDIITELRKYTKEDTMETTGRVAGILHAHPTGRAVVDVIGIGAGVVDRLRELNYNVSAFNASEHTDAYDSSNELGFANTRSAAWWHMRELLDPANEYRVALPDDTLLTGDLVSMHWKDQSGGKIICEPKDDIKERIGRSTDCGDAVVQAFYDNQQPSDNEWISAIRSRIPN
jgi:hypothetical protein